MFLKNKYQIIYNESQGPGDHRQVVVFKFEMNIMFTFQSAEIMPIFGKLLLVCKSSKCNNEVFGEIHAKMLRIK